MFNKTLRTYTKPYVEKLMFFWPSFLYNMYLFKPNNNNEFVRQSKKCVNTFTNTQFYHQRTTRNKKDSNWIE